MSSVYEIGEISLSKIDGSFDIGSVVTEVDKAHGLCGKESMYL